MSLILQRYAKIGNCFKCHRLFTRQIEIRRFLSCSKLLQNKTNKEVAPSEEKVEGQLQISFAKKAKENVKTASYSAVVLAGIGIVGTVLYVVGKELFAGDTPQDFFQYGSDKCMAHEKVQDLLGEPIKSYGVATRRHKSKQVKHMYYQDENGKKGLRIQFDLIGCRRQAICELDAREDTNGKLQTRYIIVTTTDMNRKSVIVEDNR